jgi:UDP-N-acetylglucosamine transferase subunit ALG13
VPLIEKFLTAGFKVIIAAEGDQKILLQSIFPALELVELRGYRIKYGSTKWTTIFKIFFQIPQILTAINRENKWLKGIIANKPIDVIVSDNRFGLHNRNIVSVFITHQLLIKTSIGKFTDRIIQKINYSFINQFDYCWVPDAADDKNLAGALSHPVKKPAIPVVYTGILSAVQKENIPVTNKLLVLLSGPEPQRTILENILLAQLINYTGPVIIVRGLPAAITLPAVQAGVTVFNYLSGQALQQLINASAIIISRSGYSTLMDVLPLGKQCIVIPTPGQAEQEYLAAWLAQQHFVYTAKQRDFSLSQALAAAAPPVVDLSFLKNENSTGKAISSLRLLLDARH